MRILVTGGAGFIGSEFARQLLRRQSYEVLVIDALTYAGNLNNLADISSEITFANIDIRDTQSLEAFFSEHKIDCVVHFAAESHVDNSIRNPGLFLDTNVTGTINLLNLAVKFDLQKFLHVSTDEVYGSLDFGLADENHYFSPSSPYSASKAAAEHFVNAWSKTYKLNTSIVRCSNNYGPRQHKEKLIPLAISRLLFSQKIPIYGSGQNVREWIHVEDCASGILTVLESGASNQVYNISSGNFLTNLELATELLDIFGLNESSIEFVEDRKGHDFRYAIDSTRIRKELGWDCKIDLRSGLKSTVDWYKDSKYE